MININGWEWQRDDQAIALNELKYGLFAQSCLAPGFSTLMSNLLVASSTVEITDAMPDWRKEYLPSTNKVILAETLSPTFVGMPFHDAASILYTRFDILLVAIEERKYEGGSIFINPKNYRIKANNIGLFFASSSDEVKNAWIFCMEHHAHIHNPDEIKRCNCRDRAISSVKRQINQRDTRRQRYDVGAGNSVSPDFYNFDTTGESRSAIESGASSLHLPKLKRRKKSNLSNFGSDLSPVPQQKVHPDLIGDDNSHRSKILLDTTGCFYWCPSRSFHDALKNQKELGETVLRNHIVIGVLAESDSPLLGLKNLVLPLRASSTMQKDIMEVVLIGNKEFLEREWFLLKNLPKVTVLDGSILNRAHLRSVSVNKCRRCIILSSKGGSKDEPVLADKEIILAALNIKSMKFPDDDADRSSSRLGN